MRLVLMLAAAGCLVSSACCAASQQPAPAPAAPAPSGATQPGSIPSGSAQAAPIQSPPAPSQSAAPPVRSRDRKRAARLFLEGTRLFDQGKFEAAISDYESAAKLDPSATNYALAAQVARGRAANLLVQQAAKARTQGNAAGARALLEHARALDPANPEIAPHLRELADDNVANVTAGPYPGLDESLSALPHLEPNNSVQSFHFRTDRRQAIQRVYKAYGIDAAVDQSVNASIIRFDIDKVAFADAIRALEMATTTFAVPLDPRHVVVARDTRGNRQEFQRLELETIYLPGLKAADLTEVTNIAKNVFAVPHVAAQENTGTVTLRATAETLNAFNATLQDLVDGRGEVMLDVNMIQLAHSSQRDTGLQLPQQITAFNLYAEEQSILNGNQALVQQIISSGLASADNPLAILAILIASGQVSSNLFANGIAVFGGGLTQSAISPGPVSLNLMLNSSDSHELDAIRLRLLDGQDETLRSGSRYPILQSSYSGLGVNGINIPGLSAAGNSSALAGLASSLGAAGGQIPQVSYEDLGMTLKTLPRVMRNGDVALTLDMKLTSLAGSSSNGIPVLNNRSYSGVVTVKEGEAVVLMSELDKSETFALNGTPGISDVPGLNDLTGINNQRNYATLLVVLTPHRVAGPKFTGHSPMIRIDRDPQATAGAQ